jgi:hypothetical protein
VELWKILRKLVNSLFSENNNHTKATIQARIDVDEQSTNLSHQEHV